MLKHQNSLNMATYTETLPNRFSLIYDETGDEEFVQAVATLIRETNRFAHLLPQNRRYYLIQRN